MKGAGLLSGMDLDRIVPFSNRVFYKKPTTMFLFRVMVRKQIIGITSGWVENVFLGQVSPIQSDIEREAAEFNSLSTCRFLELRIIWDSDQWVCHPPYPVNSIPCYFVENKRIYRDCSVMELVHPSNIDSIHDSLPLYVTMTNNYSKFFIQSNQQYNQYLDEQNSKPKP